MFAKHEGFLLCARRWLVIFRKVEASLFLLRFRRFIWYRRGEYYSYIEMMTVILWDPTVEWNDNFSMQLFQLSNYFWFSLDDFKIILNVLDTYRFFKTPFIGFLRLSGVGCIDIRLGVFWLNSKAMISWVRPLWFSLDSNRLVTPVGVSPSQSKILFLFLARKLKWGVFYDKYIKKLTTSIIKKLY